MKKPKIVIENLTNETRVVTRGERRRSSLILVSFDTYAVRRINDRRREEFGRDEDDLICPAKYALSWSSGGDDVGIFAQVLLGLQKYRVKAVWFDDFYDLPVAIEKLHKMFPDEDLPDQVGCLVDWPFNRRNRMYAGDSIIDLETPAKTTV